MHHRPPWNYLPTYWPVSGQTVWCRLADPLTAPFQAVWTLSTGLFTLVSNGLTLPWTSIVCWSDLSIVPPKTSLIVSGCISPAWDGIYTQRGILNARPYYQASNLAQWIYFHTAANRWMLSSLLGSSPPTRWDTGPNPDPTIMIAKYWHVGVYTGDPTVAYTT